jgi:hypothetical protein
VLAIAGPEAADQIEAHKTARSAAHTLVSTQWERVAAVADVLMERKTLDEGECRSVLED